MGSGSVAAVAAAAILAGSPPPGCFATGATPGNLAVADFNRDRKVDLAVVNAESANVTILLGDGKGGFAPAPGSPFPAGPHPNDIAAGDFNRDGLLDLAIANHETPEVTLLLGDGKGGFAPAARSPVRFAVKPHVHGLAASDFNG